MSHSEIDLDPDEQINLRYRLFARAIRINGLSQINALQPYLQARLEDTFAKELAPQNIDGNIDRVLNCKIRTNNLSRLGTYTNRSYNAGLCYRNVGGVFLRKEAMYVDFRS